MLGDSQNGLNRRNFLLASAASAIAVASPLAAAMPISRTGQPFFKLSLAAYSFHKQMVRNWPTPSAKAGEMSLSEVVDFCAQQNLDAVELTSYYFPNPLSADYLNAIKEQTYRLGLDISGTAIGNNFCLAPGPERDAQLLLCRQWIDFAADMGAPVIRIFAGNLPKGDTEEVAVARCVEGIEESLKHAAQRGVILALENHGGITATPDQLLKIVHRVKDSPWFGVNFDSGNFRTADPYGDLEKIAPYAVNAQIKLSVAPQGGPKVPTDLPRVISILKQVAFRGYVVLEYEEPEDPRIEVPKALARLRELIS